MAQTEAQRRYCERNKEKLKQKQKEWYIRNRDRVLQETVDARLAEPWKHSHAVTKRRARRAGIPFDLTVDHLKDIWTDRCPILGIELVSGSEGGKDNSPSLDRLVPEKGYTIGNVVVISYRANRMKSDATLQEILMLAEWAKKTL